VSTPILSCYIWRTWYQISLGLTETHLPIGSGASIQRWLKRGLFLRFTTTSLTISSYAGGHIHKIWYPDSGKIVRSSHVDFNEDSDEDDNQPIAGSTTGGPRGPTVIQMLEMMQSSHSDTMYDSKAMYFFN
jgi:hypothetical protein